jgi:ABC-type transporter Mla maintaining outer membrane lipid asymmetry ATPase subunit MlaF
MIRDFMEATATLKSKFDEMGMLFQGGALFDQNVEKRDVSARCSKNDTPKNGSRQFRLQRVGLENVIQNALKSVVE